MVKWAWKIETKIKHFFPLQDLSVPLPVNMP